MPVSLILDPGSTQVDLLAAPLNVPSFSMPTPALDPRWAQPADADGDRLVGKRYLNRDISIAVEIVPTNSTTAARRTAAQDALAALADKVARTNREGLVLQYTTPAGDVLYFDLITADPFDPSRDIDWDVAQVERRTLKFTAAPYARQVETSYTAARETTNPALIFTITAPAGDVPALGRLVITDLQGANQKWLVAGMQSATYSASSTAALYWAVASSTTFSGTLATSAYKAIASTQATGGGSHMTHVGTYRVFARLQRGSGNRHVPHSVRLGDW